MFKTKANELELLWQLMIAIVKLSLDFVAFYRITVGQFCNPPPPT